MSGLVPILVEDVLHESIAARHFDSHLRAGIFVSERSQLVLCVVQTLFRNELTIGRHHRNERVAFMQVEADVNAVLTIVGGRTWGTRRDAYSRSQGASFHILSSGASRCRVVCAT